MKTVIAPVKRAVPETMFCVANSAMAMVNDKPGNKMISPDMMTTDMAVFCAKINSITKASSVAKKAQIEGNR